MSWPRSLRSALSLRPLRFLMVGFANTALGLAAVYLAKFALRFDDIAANATGYAVGLAVGYLMNSIWTFGYSGRPATAMGKFLSAFLISYGANLLVVWYLIEQASVNSYIAQAAGALPYTICFYLLCRAFVFRDKQGRIETAPQMRA